MVNYAQHISPKATPQTEKVFGRESEQTVNHAGGVSFALDDWARLRRFLILGSDGPTYYQTEQKLTRENAECVVRCLAADGPRAVAAIRDVSVAGTAPKNDPAIFALALAAKQGDEATRRAAFAALPEVCRIGTHLFAFIGAVQALGGWGRATKRAVGAWYQREPRDVLFQMLKYPNRLDFAHRDALRLAHPKPLTDDHKAVYRYATKAEVPEGVTDSPDGWQHLLAGYLALQQTTEAKTAARLITDYQLPREMVPTALLNDGVVWEALLPHMPPTALLRNLATMTRAGLIAPLSAGTRSVVEKLGQTDQLVKARVHPIAVLTALKQYAAGHGLRSSSTWTPVQQVVDALDGAFYATFKSITPTGKRWLLALDVSGSMGGGAVAGVQGLTPMVASAAMVMVTAATEREHVIVAFSHQMVPVNLSPLQRLDGVVDHLSRIPMGGTDCALPMLWAMQNKIPVDAFAVYTDSETWAGRTMHPYQALQHYRQAMGIPAKLIVIGMVSNGFTIADPKDGGMLDVVGFDSAAPAVMSDFVLGGLSA